MGVYDKAKSSVSSKKYRNKCKNMVLDHYGRKCNWCGETDPMCLVLDHVNNDGCLDKKKSKTRGGTNFYTLAIKQGFPNRFQILCANCNTAKMINKGVLPEHRRGLYD